MKHLKRLLYFIPILSLILSSCSTNIDLKLPEGEEKLVVEGHIEPGMPPLILLTKSTAYFASTNINDVSNTFVHNAVIKVSDGTDTVSLIEINLTTIPDSLAKMIMDLYQINVHNLSTGFNFTFYTSFSMTGVSGKTYSLTVDAQGKRLTSITTIPELVIPDSFWVVPPTNDPLNDSMMLLYFAFKDPPAQSNYYRYFTKRNKEPFYPDRFASVFDDNLFNGQDIKWNLSRGASAYDSFDMNTYGMFWKGDTVVVKFCTIDLAQRDFWQTLESARSTGGPYANPIQIKSNIVGGLGIWGGYGSVYHTVYIPK
jgi:hypothetical protein